MRWLEEREPDLDAEVLDAVPQNVNRAALVDLGREPPEEVRARGLPAAVPRGELAPLLRLRRLDEREDLAGIEPEFAVERVRVALRVPAVLEQPRLDLPLELALYRAAQAVIVGDPTVGRPGVTIAVRRSARIWSWRLM